MITDGQPDAASDEYASRGRRYAIEPEFRFTVNTGKVFGLGDDVLSRDPAVNWRSAQQQTPAIVGANNASLNGGKGVRLQSGLPKQGCSRPTGLNAACVL
jgi:hypothetical protein